ncbi:hypothetical protein C1H46_039299 [Malus baccata]|uniref:Uncharacterized protein n=1 Tax=Malus baccata TaxID=106549 RepID=A0A540KLU9_MALBA|nr:hypothetical protein C1H46_039299 [Malus baccata]
MGAIAAISWVALLTKEALFTEAASGFELPLVAPNQTVAEAEDEVRGHALIMQLGTKTHPISYYAMTTLL